MGDQPPRKSLKDEIEKRKTQELMRQIEENKRTSQAMSPVPRKTGPLTPPDQSKEASPQPKGTGPLSAPKPTGPLSPPAQPAPAQSKGTGPLTERKKTGPLSPPPPTPPVQVKGTGPLIQRKQTGPLLPPTPKPRETAQLATPVPTPKPRQTGALTPRAPDDISRIRQTLTSEAVQEHLRSRPFQIAIAAGLLILVVSLGTFFVAGSVSKPPPLPTPIQFAQVRALEAVNYLKRVGMPVSNLTPFSVPNKTWRAQEEIQFDVESNGNTGTYIILSYVSIDT